MRESVPRSISYATVLRVLREPTNDKEFVGHRRVNTIEQAKSLGVFLQERLKTLNYSYKEFAKQLNIEEELVLGVLYGSLPAAEIDDPFLEVIARVVKLPACTLRSFLGRELR